MKRLRLNLPLLLGLLLALGLIAFALLPRFITMPKLQGPLTVWQGDLLLKAPFKPGQAGHLLGTDGMGQDLLVKLLNSAWPTLQLGIGITLGRALLAIPLGLLAGWYGGRLGKFVALLASLFSAMPTMIFALVTTEALWAIFYNGLTRPVWLVWSSYLVLIVAGFPRLAQQVRQLTEGIRQQPYLESAAAVGASTFRTLYRYVLPAMRTDLLVTMAAEASWVLMLLAQLGIFHLTIAQAPTWADWFGAGLFSIRTEPWLALYPGLALGLTVACFQLLAEGLRRRLTNQR